MSELVSRARDLLERSILIDTHIDVPYRLRSKPEDISKRTSFGDFDYPRCVEGGLKAAFFAIYIPATYQLLTGAKALADGLIDQVEDIIRSHPGKFASACSPADIRQVATTGKIAIPLGLENGTALESDLENLDHFHRRGIRYMTLTHSRDNSICDSSYDRRETWSGLSPFGRNVVTRMNDLGMIIDVSHVSDKAFFEIIDRSDAPVAATHSSARHFTPGLERNMSDEMIRKLAEAGGTIQINFGSRFLTEEIYRRHDELESDILSRAAKLGMDPDSTEGHAFISEAWDAGPRIGFAPLGAVADHIDHVVDLVGIDHVGIGSDFDGVGDTLPHGLKDVSMYPNLIAELLRRGYRDEDIQKICGENFLRVWQEVESRTEKN